MACVEVTSANADSEMEEGEIVDGADDLSDISSEEEFLLRQRLQVLENYNNVLERKEAKRTSIVSDAENGLSKLSVTITREQKPLKSEQKQKRSKQNVKDNSKIKEHKRKNHRSKKKITIVSDSETSDISEDEYRFKRQRLEHAVSLNKVKHDTSTLKERINKMICRSKTEDHHIKVLGTISKSLEILKDDQFETESNKLGMNPDNVKKLQETDEPVKVCTEDESINKPDEISQDVVDSAVIESKQKSHSDANSDEDIELLRQLALKTKSIKLTMPKDKVSIDNKPVTLSEDEDSDTAELRMICLKSAVLKKAIEIKQKQKLQKRLSQSSIVQDDFDIQNESDINLDNNTDIESVDMDIGSDAEDKGKIINDCNQKNEIKTNNEDTDKANCQENLFKDELEDDEDLLRAKLLTSLSKNLPNFVELNVLDTVFATPEVKTEDIAKVQTEQEEKKFIIQLGESDSEGENEATKNLTRMHMKLSEQQEFQNKLDLFLKSTRMEVEKNKLPDVIQNPVPKPPEKIVVKAMNHLPKSEQIEYRNLVKRMAELEKLKQARQQLHKIAMAKETLKPRNLSLESYKIAYAKKIEDKIVQSRKKIAEESEKMLKLKEESTKLSQRYKIVATELKNIATAVTINKKQQRVVQNGLSKIRHQHQMLIKNAPSKYLHSQNMIIGRPPDKIINTAKLQKENDPSKEEHKNPTVLKSLKVSVVNNLSNDNAVHPRLSVQVDISNNKKIVKMPKSPLKDRVVDIMRISPENTNNDLKNEELIKTLMVENVTRSCEHHTEPNHVIPKDLDDYKSPLDSLQCKNWEEDPNGVLCPFEVGGSCRDPDCKYLHPKPQKIE